MPPNTFSRNGLRLHGSARLPIVLSEQNVEESEAAVLQEYEMIDLTEEALPQQTQAESHVRYHYEQVRNASVESSHRSRSVYRFGDTELKPDTCVELREPFGKWQVQFVEIKSIWVSNSDGSVVIRGIPYTRNRNLSGALENKKNEVCQVLEIDSDDQRSDEVQALFQISHRQILQVRTLNKTNAIFPRYHFGDDRQWLDKTPLEREEHAPLTCRWKFRIQYRDSRFRNYDRPDAWALVRMAETECYGRLRIPDKELRVVWRGRTHRGGSHKPQVINLDGPEPVPAARNDRQYTFADVFCGAGGASRGAVMAGLKLVFGVDHWPQACATWRRNFPGARMCEQDASDFIHKCEIGYRSHPIDILHLSPPCQFWSPLAYPYAGRNNEENMAILFACSELVKKIRPRLFTLEQTFGLTHAAHAEFLNALVQGFTCHGYSVQWKIVPLVEYGLPQTRKRLVMIGACPGEQLPPWPPATHSAAPARGLKPFVTEAEAIRNLNGRGVSLHDVADTIARNFPPRNGNAPFPKTITCGGTQSTSHFSGRRGFTLREIACLQGFPVSHQFEGNKTAIKKQIGNAFPPCVVKAFYDHLRAWLQRVDGVQGAAPSQARPPAPRLPGPPVSRRRRSIEAHWYHLNGDLEEDEALELALQESGRSARVIEIPDDDGDQQPSPVAAVAPLLERMSFAPPDAQPGRGAESPLQSRSRSVTLDFSPGPSPGPSRRAAAAAAAAAATSSQKRSLDLMHDGDADEALEEESPPKRERALEAGDRERGVVDDKIPSGLPRYGAAQGAHEADDENVAVGRPKRVSSQHGSRDTHEDGSPSAHRASHRRSGVEDATAGNSEVSGSSNLSRAGAEAISDDEAWTF